MKRLLVYAAATLVAVAAFAWANLGGRGTSDGAIVGAWKLESANYNGQPRGTGTTQIKLISKNRFLWVDYDPAKNKAVASGTGSYVFTGSSYTEHVDLLDANDGQGNPYVGKDYTFSVKIEGNTLTQTGTMGQLNLQETWKRMD